MTESDYYIRRIGEVFEGLVARGLAADLNVSDVLRGGESAASYTLSPRNPKSATIEAVVGRESGIIDLSVGEWCSFELPEDSADSRVEVMEHVEAIVEGVVAGQVRERHVHRRGRLATYSILVGSEESPIARASWVESFLASIPVGQADVVDQWFEPYGTVGTAGAPSD